MTRASNAVLALAVGFLLIGRATADENLASSLPAGGESDNPALQVALAVKYEHAEGVPLNYAKAAELYCRAARSGNADAQFALGWMYANGRGVARDDSVAVQLFTMADEQGHAHAKDVLRYIHAAATSPLPACLQPDEPVITLLEEERPGKGGGLRYAWDEQAGGAEFSRGPIFDLVHKLAANYDVDPNLVLAVITVESGFKARALSPKNAQGLMQLIPETAQRFRVRNAYDPVDNIKGGMAYLQWLLAYFKGNVPLVAAAYNAGERAVEKYRGIPPYPETREYVQRITNLYRRPTHPYNANLVKEATFLNSPRITRP